MCSLSSKDAYVQIALFSSSVSLNLNIPMSKFIKSASLAVLSAITFGAVAPAFAGDFINSDPGCRRIVSNAVGPEQPRAVSGLDNNQVAFYNNPSDIFSGSPTAVKAIGERVILAYPREEQFVKDGQTTGGGVVMIAIRHDDGSKKWIPLADGSSDRNGKNIETYGKSTLGYCSVQGMW